MTRKLNVLVVDDNIINLTVARGLLTSLGHTGVLVQDGAKALRCLEQFRFDVVLMDVMMPVMDGLQTVSAIREAEKATGKHQAIVMVTSHAEPGDDIRFMNAGADGYIAKPLDVAVLDKTLRDMSR